MRRRRIELTGVKGINVVQEGPVTGAVPEPGGLPPTSESDWIDYAITEMIRIPSRCETEFHDAWYRVYNSGTGLTFEGGLFLPSAIDSVRFDTYKRKGLAAMLELDTKIRRDWDMALYGGAYQDEAGNRIDPRDVRIDVTPE